MSYHHPDNQIVPTNLNPNNFGGNRIAEGLLQLLEFHKSMKQWYESTEDFKKTTTTLMRDTYKSFKAFNKSPANQSIRRQLIRNMFAWFEGQIFLMKSISIARYYNFKVEFSNADLAILREDKYILSDKGEAHSNSSNYQKFVPNYLFAFRCFLKSHGATFSFDQDRTNDLRRLERVRNRLTHPKCFADLTVEDDEIRLADIVRNWHSEQTSSALKAVKNGNVVEGRNFVDGVGGSLQVTLLVLLIMWKTGEIFEFTTRKNAKSFALALAATPSIDYTIILAFKK